MRVANLVCLVGPRAWTLKTFCLHRVIDIFNNIYSFLLLLRPGFKQKCRQGQTQICAWPETMTSMYLHVQRVLSMT
jgi:hypothetical protein